MTPRISLALVCLLACFPSSGGGMRPVSAVSQESQSVSPAAYWRVVQQFRQEDAQDAAIVAAAWRPGSMDQARRSLGSANPAALAAAVSLHTAVALKPLELATSDPDMHLDMARRALALAGDDELAPRFRARWYLAVVGGLLGQARLAAAIAYGDEAVVRLPMDPEILVAAGALDEFLASPQCQIDSGTHQRADTAIGVPSGQSYTFERRRREALKRAESYYRMALCLDSGAGEARVRLARVLILTGRAEAALEELRVVETSPGSAHHDSRTRYLAAMFRGAAHQAAHRWTQSMQAYADAETLCGGCLSPGIAASAAQRDAGDPDSAFATLQAALDRDRRTPRRDPWWDYPLGSWWRMPQLLQELREAVR